LDLHLPEQSVAIIAQVLSSISADVLDTTMCDKVLQFLKAKQVLKCP